MMRVQPCLCAMWNSCVAGVFVSLPQKQHLLGCCKWGPTHIYKWKERSLKKTVRIVECSDRRGGGQGGG